MPKALCFFSLAVSGILALVFLFDLVMGLLGSVDLAPFGGNSIVVDVVFFVIALLLAFMSWTTLREQR